MHKSSTNHRHSCTQTYIFYLSKAECPGGNYLYEYQKGPFFGWQNGSLNALQICSSNQSNLLYALEPRAASASSTTTGPIRVGYMAANTNYLSEVYESGTSWTAVAY